MAKRKSPKTQQAPVAAPVRDDMTLAQKISWWSLLAMLAIVPIAISNLTFLGMNLPISYDQFDIIKVFFQRIFGLVALAAWVWHMATRGGKVRHTPVDWAILGFLVWVAISSILSIHPPTAFFGKYRRFEGWLSFANYAVIYFLILQFADRPSRIKRIAQVLFWSGLVVTSYGVLQYLGADPLVWGTLPFEANRAFSTYGNPDLLGGFLMFSTFVSMGLALSEKNLVWRGVYWFGTLVSFACIVVAFTRSAWVGGFVGVVVFVAIAIWQRVEWKTEDWVFAAISLFAALVPLFRSLSNPNPVLNFGQRFASIFEFGEGSAKTRFEIWDAAMKSVADRPIFGFGPDTFRLVFPKYKPIEYVADAGYLSVADNVHNYPLQLASGIGIPGVALFYGIIGWAAARSAKVVFVRNGGPDRILLGGFWAACAAYVVHLFFGLSVTGTSFLLWLSMAVLLAPTAVSIEFRPPSWGIAVAAVVAILAMFGVGYQFVYMQADQAYLMARIGAQGPQRTFYAERAVQLNPFNDMYRAEVGLAYTDEVIDAINRAAGAQQSGQDPTALLTEARTAFDRAEGSLLDTIEFVPSEYDNYVFITNLYNLGGQFFQDPTLYERSEEYAIKGIKDVEPYGPALRYQYGRMLYDTGRYEDAIRQLDFAHRMDTAYAQLTLLLAEAYQRVGRPQDALRVLRATETRSPGQAGVADAISRLASPSAPTTVAPAP